MVQKPLWGLQDFSPNIRIWTEEKKSVSRATGRKFLLCLSLVNITSLDGNTTSTMVLSTTLYCAFRSWDVFLLISHACRKVFLASILWKEEEQMGWECFYFSLSSFATGCCLTAGSSKWVHSGKIDILYNILFWIFCQKKDLCRKPVQVHIKKSGFSDTLQLRIHYSELGVQWIMNYVQPLCDKFSIQRA